MYNQENSIVLREELGKVVGVQIQHEKYFDFIKVENSCWPNVLFNFKVKHQEVDDFILTVKNGIDSGRMPSVLVTDESQQKSDVLENIKDRDFKVGHWSIMEHRLQNLSDHKENEEIEIVRVRTPEQLSHWLRICETELMKGKMDERMFSSKLNHNKILLFLGMHKGKPVATSLVFIRKEDSGLYFIATDSNSRRKGFGKAITLHGLRIAEEQKSSVMYLEATDLGLSVYKSVGFIDYGPVTLINFAKKANVK